jgi:hypothetical protein
MEVDDNAGSPSQQQDHADPSRRDFIKKAAYLGPASIQAADTITTTIATRPTAKVGARARARVRAKTRASDTITASGLQPSLKFTHW